MRRTADQMELHVARVVNSRVDGNKPLSRFADLTALSNALGMAFATGWEILCPLVLGFALSAVIQAVVSHREMSRLLRNDSPRSIGIALALGAASSSCSYAPSRLRDLSSAKARTSRLLWLSRWHPPTSYSSSALSNGGISFGGVLLSSSPT